MALMKADVRGKRGGGAEVGAEGEAGRKSLGLWSGRLLAARSDLRRFLRSAQDDKAYGQGMNKEHVNFRGMHN